MLVAESGLDFDRLYERYSRLVHGILLAHVPYADAEDLMQDVFLQAIEKLGTLSDPRAVGGWLATIARRRAIDFHRGRRPTEPIENHDRGRSDSRGEALLVLAEIRHLPEAYRETLILRLVEGMTGPEIAERTGLTHDSVRVNLHRGMKLLRERLEG
ncbi:MAG: sigma-70 family RNA polymerase sigma factor [Bryobacteraceae bacterium]|nr:sigma-70 family RNA polymerase sigma factor [Bryobacteraceae bacterium]